MGMFTSLKRMLITTAAGFVLMPRINALRDRQLAGDAAAKAQFDLLHRSSVIINFVQIAAAAWLLYVLG